MHEISNKSDKKKEMRTSESEGCKGTFRSSKSSSLQICKMQSVSMCVGAESLKIKWKLYC